jgi:hypothetical protein
MEIFPILMCVKLREACYNKGDVAFVFSMRETYFHVGGGKHGTKAGERSQGKEGRELFHYSLTDSATLFSLPLPPLGTSHGRSRTCKRREENDFRMEKVTPANGVIRLPRLPLVYQVGRRRQKAIPLGTKIRLPLFPWPPIQPPPGGKRFSPIPKPSPPL